MRRCGPPPEPGGALSPFRSGSQRLIVGERPESESEGRQAFIPKTSLQLRLTEQSPPSTTAHLRLCDQMQKNVSFGRGPREDAIILTVAT